MLVLRRRPSEAIVFDGGLMLTLLRVGGGSAWVGFTGGGLEQEVVLGLPASGTDRAELSVTSPRSLTRQEGTTTIELASVEEADPEAVLTLTRKPGETLLVGELSLSLEPIEEDRVYLELTTKSLPGPVVLSIVTVSSVDARIGVNAPADLRVYRKEVWDEMQEANTAAAGEWSPEDLAALSTEGP